MIISVVDQKSDDEDDSDENKEDHCDDSNDNNDDDDEKLRAILGISRICDSKNLNCIFSSF